jgi:hypothetical protein
MLPRFPADLVVYTSETSLPADWPSNKRSVSSRTAIQCVVWTEMRAALDGEIDPMAFTSALQALGGSLVDFWDQTTGEVIIGEPLAVPPSPPVTPPQTAPPPGPVPAPAPSPAPRKKASAGTKFAWVSIVGTAIGIFWKTLSRPGRRS